MIEKGQILSLREIFKKEFLTVEELSEDLKISSFTLQDKLLNPGKFLLSDLFALAYVFNVRILLIFRLIRKDYCEGRRKR